MPGHAGASPVLVEGSLAGVCWTPDLLPRRDGPTSAGLNAPFEWLVGISDHSVPDGLPHAHTHHAVAGSGGVGAAGHRWQRGSASRGTCQHPGVSSTTCRDPDAAHPWGSQNMTVPCVGWLCRSWNPVPHSLCCTGGRQEDAWKGRAPDAHPALRWDERHTCHWGAAESPWAALALSLCYGKAYLHLPHLCDPLPGGQARKRSFHPKGWQGHCE